MNKYLISYLRARPYLILWGVVGITIAALLLTLIPADYLSKSSIWSYDKLGHLLLFGSWTYLLGLYVIIEYPAKHNLWKIFSLGVLFGGAIEILQYLLPVNRHGDIADFTVDVMGAIGAVILLKIFPSSPEE